MVRNCPDTVEPNVRIGGGMRMTVVGTGYLGATHAACMAELGHDVLGVDTDPTKVERLNAGKSPFYEPGLKKLLKRGVSAGKLRFTTDPAEAAEFAKTHFLDRKSTRLNSSHVSISYAVFCLKKKKKET